MNLTGIGRLAKDPKMSYTPKGTAQTQFTVAYNAGYGENKNTVWVSLICWGAQAEIINEKFSKGQRIFFSAEVNRLNTYIKEDGTAGGSIDAKLTAFNWVDKSEPKGESNHNTPFESDYIPEEF